MNYLVIIILALISYLLGSFPSGYILVKNVKKVDLTEYGSKHTGATNTTRLLGAGYGSIALTLDALKGVIVMVFLYVLKLEQYYIINDALNILPFYGVIAAWGHVFSFYLNFRGGKAVATSFGILTFFCIILNIWWVLIIAFIAFILAILLTKYVSLGSILATVIAMITAIIYYIIDPLILPLEYLIAIILLATTIIIKHQENIRRLFKGTENKINLKKR